MTQALSTPVDAQVLEQVVLAGDLSDLSPEKRVLYYRSVCESLGLNPLTKPLSYIRLNNKLILYANRDCTDQLRERAAVSISITSREVTEGIYVVTAQAALPSGRTDESVGAVPIDNLKGEARANAMMKAETKAKRRVTLSIVGLGWLDEMEIDSIPDAVWVNPETGEAPAPIADRPKALLPAQQGLSYPNTARTKDVNTAFWLNARQIVGTQNTHDVVCTMLRVNKLEEWTDGHTLADALVVLKGLQEGEQWEDALLKVTAQ